jgi:predicted Zn finger-like uncharacterized protein
MSFEIACPDCHSRLKMREELAGRKVRCPRCGAEFPAIAISKLERVEAVREAPPRKKQAPSVPQSSAEEQYNSPTEPTPDADRPRKKKRRRKKPEPSGVPAWIWWVGGGVGLSMLTILFLLIIFLGMKQEAQVYCLAMVIMLPISLGILILSMFASSAFGGGIEFGEAHIVIPKAAGLLLVVNFVTIACWPFGSILTLFIWPLGLMNLFRLDFWETRLLVTTNWGLNLIARWIVVALIISAFSSGRHDSMDMVDFAAEKQDTAPIEALGGRCDLIAGPDSPVTGIRLNGTQVKDQDLVILQNYPDLRFLDLSDTAVTDAAVPMLADLDLNELVVTNTKMTKAGVNKLRRANPTLKVKR